MGGGVAQPFVRGSGRTSDQLRAAPLRAYYVWAPWITRVYVQNLAKHLMRDDLRIIPAAEWWRGHEPLKSVIGRMDFVVDHAAWLSMTALEVVEWDRVVRRVG